MLKFGMEIDYGVIQKRYAAIFEILIFRNFSGGQSSNFRHFVKILDFDPLKKREKSKIYLHPKFQHQRTCRFLDPSRFMSKLTIFSTKCIFPYI